MQSALDLAPAWVPAEIGQITKEIDRVNRTSGSTGTYGYGSNNGSTILINTIRATFAQSNPPSTSSIGRRVNVKSGQISRYA